MKVCAIFISYFDHLNKFSGKKSSYDSGIQRKSFQNYLIEQNAVIFNINKLLLYIIQRD
jgi:hypothetical protein